MTTLLSALFIFLLSCLRIIALSARIAIATKLSGDSEFISAEEFGYEENGVERTCNESFFNGKMAVMAPGNLLFNKDLEHLYCNRGLCAIFT